MQAKINHSAGKEISTRIFVLILPIFFLLTSFVSFTGEKKINFSGEWSLNESKTNLGDMNFNVVGSKIVIDQKDSVLFLTRFTTGFNGESMKFEEKYTLNGKECENKGFNNSPKKSIVKWSEDGKNMVITSTILFTNEGGDQMEIKSTEQWKLSEDGNSISIDYKSTSGMGDLNQLYVFDKAVGTH